MGDAITIEGEEVSKTELHCLQQLVNKGRYDAVVDAFLIPLEEIEEAAGRTVSLALIKWIQNPSIGVTKNSYCFAVDTAKLEQLGLKPPEKPSPGKSPMQMLTEDLMERFRECTELALRPGPIRWINRPASDDKLTGAVADTIIVDDSAGSPKPQPPEPVLATLKRIAGAIPEATLAMAEERGAPDGWEVDHRITLGEVKAVRAYLNEIHACGKPELPESVESERPEMA